MAELDETEIMEGDGPMITAQYQDRDAQGQTQDESNALAPETEEVSQEVVQDEPEVTEEAESDLEKRMRNMAARTREADKRARQLQAELEALRAGVQPDQMYQRQVMEQAALMAREQAFTDRCNEVVKAGEKDFGADAFNRIKDDLNAIVGWDGGLKPIVEAALDMGNTHKIMKYLHDNPDKLHDIVTLPPVKLGAAVANIGVELSKPKVKALSKAPAPMKTVAATSPTGSKNLDEMSTEEFMAWDQAQTRKRMGLK